MNDIYSTDANQEGLVKTLALQVWLPFDKVRNTRVAIRVKVTPSKRKVEALSIAGPLEFRQKEKEKAKSKEAKPMSAEKEELGKKLRKHQQKRLAGRVDMNDLISKALGDLL